MFSIRLSQRPRVLKVQFYLSKIFYKLIKEWDLDTLLWRTTESDGMMARFYCKLRSISRAITN